MNSYNTDPRVFELLTTQETRWQLVQREIQLLDEKIKGLAQDTREIREDVDGASNIARNSAQRAAAPLDRLKFQQIQLDAAASELRKACDRIDKLEKWRVQRESQMSVLLWFVGGLGGSSFVLQAFFFSSYHKNLADSFHKIESAPAKVEPKPSKR